MTQQEKMTACNKDATAKNLKGDARKAVPRMTAPLS
jgi:psiF repeat